jgi:hypothetical protein
MGWYTLPNFNHLNLTLPCDKRQDLNYAAKILNARATELNRQRHLQLQELETLQAISKEFELTDSGPCLP